MRAIRLHRRGGPDELVLEDAPVPEIGAGDVLVRVFATGITPTELGWDVVTRTPPGIAEQHGVRGVYFIVEGNRVQLEQIATLVDDGKLKPIIARVFPLARAREAFEFGATSHAPGKIVLEVTGAAPARPPQAG